MLYWICSFRAPSIETCFLLEGITVCEILSTETLIFYPFKTGRRGKPPDDHNHNDDLIAKYQKSRRPKFTIYQNNYFYFNATSAKLPLKTIRLQSRTKRSQQRKAPLARHQGSTKLEPLRQRQNLPKFVGFRFVLERRA